jgi:hypothetical protein
VKNVRVLTAKLSAIRKVFLEHQNYPRAAFMDYYKPEASQLFFDSAWQEAEMMLSIFISRHFPPGATPPHHSRKRA